MSAQVIPIKTRLMDQYTLAETIDKRHKNTLSVVKIALAADDPVLSHAVELTERESDNIICACFLVLDQRLQRGHITKEEYNKALELIETNGEGYE